MVDNKILTEKYEMKAIIPTLYKKEKLRSAWMPFKRRWFPEYMDIFRFYYFGKDSTSLISAEQSSIYRGTFRNLKKI